MAQADNEIGTLTLISIIFGAVAIFFGTIVTLWMKSYGFHLATIPDTQFGWMIFFSALTGLLSSFSLSLFVRMWWINRGPLIGFLWNVMVGVWGVAVTAAVVVLLYAHFLNR